MIIWFKPSPVKCNKKQQETIARLKYHAAACFYQFILPFEELLSWQEVGQQPEQGRTKARRGLGSWKYSYTFQTAVLGVQEISSLG